ncbi:MAG: esterase, partial [Bacteroidaceae bacterium]|nr:esterase [Bacteroidaceae bacterium]
MKHTKLFPVLIVCIALCSQISAQRFGATSFPEGSYSPVTNINRNSYPRILEDNSVMFRVNAPQANKVQIDLCGVKYDMQKSENGQWSVTTQPQVPGFHYYSL